MQEVLQKINDLVSLLQQKNEVTNALNKQLSNQKKQLELDQKKIGAKLNHVSAMERVYQKYADFDEAVKKFNEEKVDYTSKIKQFSEQEKANSEVLSKIKKEQEELKEQKATISRQVISLKEREASFDKKREELKGLINGNTLKDMLK